MSRALPLVLLTIVTIALVAGNAAAKKARKANAPPPAPASVETDWYAAPRPAGEGWLVVDRTSHDVILVRDGSTEPGASPEDSWSAQVLVMPPLSDGTPKGLTAFLETGYRDRLLMGGRFELVGWNATPDPARAATCVRYRLATVDREAYMGGSAAGELMLVEDGLACEVARPANGAVIAKMSWRGAKAPTIDGLASRFEAWLSGVEIVGAPLRSSGQAGASAAGSPP